MTKTLKLSGKMKTIDIGKPNVADDIGAQMAMALKQLEEMKAKCKSHFIPQVHKQIAMGGLPIEIEFIEAMTAVSGLRFEMQIGIEGLDVFTLTSLCQRMTALAGWEPTHPDMCGFSMHGYTFTMGDGDDGGAVYIRNGKLCVWVRGWRE